MTGSDLEYVRNLLSKGLIEGPVLELGGGYGGMSCREIVQASGLTYQSTDIVAGSGVDIVADFEAGDFGRSFEHHEYGCVLVLNVLEHVFEPIKVLDNAISLLRHHGKAVTITPCMWPTHSYPIDCQRLLPDWFISYGDRRQEVQLLDSVFEFVGYGPISAFVRGSDVQLPSPSRTIVAQRYSRLVHRLFNTSGRGQWAASYVAVGAVFARR